MKKLLIVFFLFLSASAFALDAPKTGDDWLKLSKSQKIAFVSSVVYTFERLDYTITTQYGDSKAPEMKELKKHLSIYLNTPDEIVSFLDNYFESEVNQSEFMWDILYYYDTYVNW